MLRNATNNSKPIADSNSIYVDHHHDNANGNGNQHQLHQ